MKKFLLLVLIILSSMLPMLFSFACKTNNVVYAASFSSAREELVLTGYNGYSPYNYIDSFSYSKTETSKYDYKNYEGIVCNEFYTVVPTNNSFLNKPSGFSTSFDLFSDYLSLSNNGILYAKAVIGVINLDNKDNSNITVSLTNNDNTKSVSNETTGSFNNDIYEPVYIETEFIKISGSNISFSVEASGKSGLFNYAKYILFEPKIVFKTEISELKINNASKTVYPGEVIMLDAENSITNLEGNGYYLNNQKNYHNITYEIVEGKDYASIVNDNLYILENSSGKSISVRAKCKQSSIFTGYIYSDNVVFSVDQNKYSISAISNFDDCCEFIGTGYYYENQFATMRAIPKQNYQFLHWNINGVINTNLTCVTKVTKNTTLEAVFKKGLSVSDIIIKNKIYDGTVLATITSLNIVGLETNYPDVEISNIRAEFASKDVGNNKQVYFIGEPLLVGDDAENYYLLSDRIGSTTANIIKRNATIYPSVQSKIYGQSDPEFDYTSINIVSGDTLQGKLSRKPGENVGQYLITIGNLETENNNYSFELNSVLFNIVSREITISSITISPKQYDKTTTASISNITINNVANNEIITISCDSVFDNYNVGQNKKVFVTNIVLTSDNASNYKLLTTNFEASGIITKKPITITITSASKIYGELDPTFEYVVENLIEGDTLGGAPQRQSGENVGSYIISYAGIINDNYEINTNTGLLNINKKHIIVNAKASSKTYGDTDTNLDFIIAGIIYGDSLSGSLSRVEGENVGKYDILIGSLTGVNYDIEFISNTFEILKREAKVIITPTNKTYDGTTDCQFTYTFENVLPSDVLSFDASIEYSDKNANSDINLVITDSSFTGEKSNCYLFSFDKANYTADITRKNLSVNTLNFSKTYGDNDPKFEYLTEGLIENDSINGELSRIEGENVGNYSYLLGTITNENNTNYNISLNNVGAFYINKKSITLEINNMSKNYGELDPVPVISLAQNSELCFNDELSSILSGNIIRESGEIYGKYLYIASTLRININYTFTLRDSYLSINKKNVDIVIQPKTKIYGEMDPSFSYTYNGVVGSDTIRLNLSREFGENVGVYKISLNNVLDNRYNFVVTENNLTINPRNIKIFADTKMKFYGDTDPVFTASIIEGMLVNNDTYAQVTSGSMTRVEGENVGEYEILQGSFSLNDNYTMEFTKNLFHIYKSPIKIKANDTSKPYYSIDGALTYSIISGKLYFDDEFNGNLERVAGESVGEYTINQGTVNLSNNYNLSFESGIFEIYQRHIKIIADAKTKTYGELDEALTYTIDGDFKEDDSLTGGLYRESGENSGTYKILSTFANPSYDIEFISANYTIEKRIINISAKNIQYVYGESSPELEYTIDSGSILEGDSISGYIYKIQGDDVGVYDIRSTLYISKNYQIIFTKGMVKILPRNLTITTLDNSKTYGSLDPEFGYVISEGALINSDTLSGTVNRESGEDVGTYNLISEIYNPNYNISANNGTFVINKKPVELFVSISDKVYNGDNIATIVSPVLSGLIDTTVSVDFDKKNSAFFETTTVGNNIPVRLENIVLVGEKSNNYSLILPTNVLGNITYSKLFSSDNQVVINANNNSNFYVGTSMQIEEIQKPTELNTKREFLSGFNITLQNSEEESVEINNTVTINLDTSNMSVGENLFVYQVDETNEYRLIKSSYKNGILSFDVDNFSTIIILTDDYNWIDIVFYCCLGVLTIVGSIFTFAKIKNYKKLKSNAK